MPRTCQTGYDERNRAESLVRGFPNGGLAHPDDVHPYAVLAARTTLGGPELGGKRGLKPEFEL